MSPTMGSAIAHELDASEEELAADLMSEDAFGFTRASLANRIDELGVVAAALRQAERNLRASGTHQHLVLSAKFLELHPVAASLACNITTLVSNKRLLKANVTASSQAKRQLQELQAGLSNNHTPRGTQPAEADAIALAEASLVNATALRASAPMAVAAAQQFFFRRAEGVVNASPHTDAAMKSPPASPRRAVRKVDPEDGIHRTLSQTLQKYAGLLSDAEVMYYWNAKCFSLDAARSQLVRSADSAKCTELSVEDANLAGTPKRVFPFTSDTTSGGVHRRSPSPASAAITTTFGGKVSSPIGATSQKTMSWPSMDGEGIAVRSDQARKSVDENPKIPLVAASSPSSVEVDSISTPSTNSPTIAQQNSRSGVDWSESRHPNEIIQDAMGACRSSGARTPSRSRQEVDVVRKIASELIALWEKESIAQSLEMKRISVELEMIRAKEAGNLEPNDAVEFELRLEGFHLESFDVGRQLAFCADLKDTLICDHVEIAGLRQGPDSVHAELYAVGFVHPDHPNEAATKVLNGSALETSALGPISVSKEPILTTKMHRPSAWLLEQRKLYKMEQNWRGTEVATAAMEKRLQELIRHGIQEAMQTMRFERELAGQELRQKSLLAAEAAEDFEKHLQSQDVDVEPMRIQASGEAAAALGAFKTKLSTAEAEQAAAKRGLEALMEEQIRTMAELERTREELVALENSGALGAESAKSRNKQFRFSTVVSTRSAPKVGTSADMDELLGDSSIVNYDQGSDGVSSEDGNSATARVNADQATSQCPNTSNADLSATPPAAVPRQAEVFCLASVAQVSSEDPPMKAEVHSSVSECVSKDDPADDRHCAKLRSLSGWYEEDLSRYSFDHVDIDLWPPERSSIVHSRRLDFQLSTDEEVVEQVKLANSDQDHQSLPDIDLISSRCSNMGKLQVSCGRHLGLNDKELGQIISTHCLLGCVSSSECNIEADLPDLPEEEIDYIMTVCRAFHGDVGEKIDAALDRYSEEQLDQINQLYAAQMAIMKGSKYRRSAQSQAGGPRRSRQVDLAEARNELRPSEFGTCTDGEDTSGDKSLASPELQKILARRRSATEGILKEDEASLLQQVRSKPKVRSRTVDETATTLEEPPELLKVLTKRRATMDESQFSFENSPQQSAFGHLSVASSPSVPMFATKKSIHLQSKFVGEVDQIIQKQLDEQRKEVMEELARVKELDQVQAKGIDYWLEDVQIEAWIGARCWPEGNHSRAMFYERRIQQPGNGAPLSEEDSRGLRLACQALSDSEAASQGNSVAEAFARYSARQTQQIKRVYLNLVKSYNRRQERRLLGFSCASTSLPLASPTTPADVPVERAATLDGFQPSGCAVTVQAQTTDRGTGDIDAQASAIHTGCHRRSLDLRKSTQRSVRFLNIVEDDEDDEDEGPIGAHSVATRSNPSRVHSLASTTPMDAGALIHGDFPEDVISKTSLASTAGLVGDDITDCKRRSRTESSVLMLGREFARRNSGKLYMFYEFAEDEANKLGEGSFGVVFKAKLRGTDIERAVKIISFKQRGSNPQKDALRLQRYEEEINTAKKLDHPNVARLYETFLETETCQIMLVMELCTGGDLMDAIMDHNDSQQAWPMKDAKRHMRHIILALCYLHANNFAHRDVKPENYIFQSRMKEASLKLIDFGLACRCVPGYTILKSCVGTVEYMAPEVCAVACQRNYDTKCDVWAAGIIGYMLHSGEFPFSGPNDAATVRLIQKCNLSFKQPAWANASEESKGFISLLMSRDQKKRPTATESLVNPFFDEKSELPLAWRPKRRARSLSNSSNTRRTRDSLGGLDIVERLQSFKQLTGFKKVALAALAQQLPDEALHKLRELFRSFDRDGNGVISIAEMEAGFVKKGFAVPENFGRLMRGADTDGSGSLDYSEFVAVMLDPKLFMDPEYRQFCKAAFRTFDVDGDGRITRDELVRLFTAGDTENRFASGQLERKIDEMMAVGDVNSDGCIDFDEFYAMLGSV